MSSSDGRAPSGQALAVPVEPEDRLDPSGFDPSRFKPNSYEGKPRWLGKARGRELNRFLEAMDAICATMDAKELAKLEEACLSVSPINCGWGQFRIADLLYHRSAAIAMEARRAATPQSDAAHDSAGLEETSPKTSQGQSDE